MTLKKKVLLQMSKKIVRTQLNKEVGSTSTISLGLTGLTPNKNHGVVLLNKNKNREWTGTFLSNAAGNGTFLIDVVCQQFSPIYGPDEVDVTLTDENGKPLDTVVMTVDPV